MSGKLMFNGKKAKLSDGDKDAKIIIHLEKEVHHLQQEIVNINQKSESDWQTVLMLESRSALKKRIKQIQYELSDRALADDRQSETDSPNPIEDPKPKTFSECFADNRKPSEVLGRITLQRRRAEYGARMENNLEWCALLDELKTTQEAHHQVVLQLGRQKQLQDSFSEFIQLNQKYSKRGTDTFDQGTPEEFEIASKELKNQQKLYEKSKNKLELQNEYDNGGIAKIKSSRVLEKENGSLKQENMDLKRNNAELIRLLENR